MKAGFREEADGACRETSGRKLSGDVREHECSAVDAQDVRTLAKIEVLGLDAKVVGRATLP